MAVDTRQPATLTSDPNRKPRNNSSSARGPIMALPAMRSASARPRDVRAAIAIGVVAATDRSTPLNPPRVRPSTDNADMNVARRMTMVAARQMAPQSSSLAAASTVTTSNDLPAGVDSTQKARTQKYVSSNRTTPG